MFRVCSLVFRVCRIVEQNQRPSTVEIIIEIRLDGVKGEIRGAWGAALAARWREEMQCDEGGARKTAPEPIMGDWRAFGAVLSG